MTKTIIVTFNCKNSRTSGPMFGRGRGTKLGDETHQLKFFRWTKNGTIIEAAVVETMCFKIVGMSLESIYFVVCQNVGTPISKSSNANCHKGSTWVKNEVQHGHFKSCRTTTWPFKKTVECDVNVL